MGQAFHSILKRSDNNKAVSTMYQGLMEMLDGFVFCSGKDFLSIAYLIQYLYIYIYNDSQKPPRKVNVFCLRT